MILGDDLMRNPWLIIHSLDVSCGDNLHQVLVSVIVLGKQDKMVISFFLQPVVSLGYVDFASDDRFHARMFGCKLEELLHTVHVAVVRDRKTRHAKFFSPVEQVFYGRLAVKNRVLCMDVKVYKSHFILILRRLQISAVSCCGTAGKTYKFTKNSWYLRDGFPNTIVIFVKKQIEDADETT